MNRFKGVIKEIETSGSLSLVKVEVESIVFSTVIIDTPETLPLLQVGKSVDVIFKESEVVLGRQPLEISMQNKVTGNIERIEKGELLSKITLSTAIGDLTALITSNAITHLKLSEGEEVVAMIKTNEIMLSYD